MGYLNDDQMNFKGAADLKEGEVLGVGLSYGPWSKGSSSNLNGDPETNYGINTWIEDSYDNMANGYMSQCYSKKNDELVEYDDEGEISDYRVTTDDIPSYLKDEVIANTKEKVGQLVSANMSLIDQTMKDKNMNFSEALKDVFGDKIENIFVDNMLIPLNEGMSNIINGAVYDHTTGDSTNTGSGSSRESSESFAADIDVEGNGLDDDMLQEQYELYNTVRMNIPQDPQYSKIKLLRGVSGIPYQFLPDTDRRLFKSNNLSTLDSIEHMGRKYIERIGQRANVLFLTPGKVSFLNGVSKEKKNEIFGRMISDIGEGAMEALLNKNETYRYYTFNFDRDNYFRYLNPMIRAAARYLGLHSYDVNGNWTGSKTGLFSGKNGLTHASYEQILASMDNGSLFTNAYSALTFYLDSVSASDDSINTQLTTSQFVDQFVKQPSAAAREIKVLLGKGLTDLTASEFWDNIADPEKTKEAQAEIESFIGTYLGNNSFAKKLALGATVVASGGQIIFPQIWSGSTFDNEPVSVTIKLSSPDCDDFSIFWNILVPMYALVCMAAPKGYVGIDGYSEPFMVRAFCQSMFHIEAGYITGLSIRKGGEGYWTKSGLPTVLEITLQIQDIYDAKYISTSEKGKPELNFNIIQDIVNIVDKTFQKTPFLRNTAMLNWIANTCGVNVNKPDLLRDIEMYIEHSLENPVSDLFTNFSNSLFDTLRNFSPSLLNLLGFFR